MSQENNELTLYEIELEKQKTAELKAIELQEKKHRINNVWCNYMAWIFEKYRDEFQETFIFATESTSGILKKNGVQIDGITQDDIYQGFNIIIQDQKHIEDYLQKQRGKHSTESMPW